MLKPEARIDEIAKIWDVPRVMRSRTCVLHDNVKRTIIICRGSTAYKSNGKAQDSDNFHSSKHVDMKLDQCVRWSISYTYMSSR
jgi:hypothetical protein